MKLKTKNGYEFEIDDEDFRIISRYNWYGYKARNKIKTGDISWKSSYVYTSMWINKKSQNIRLHRLILEAPKGVQIDHINGNGLDNRKANLRFCNNSQNLMNQRKRITNKSGYKGVSLRANGKKKKWVAQIRINGNNKFIGHFETAAEAAIAYNNKAKELFGEFARLNEVEEPNGI